MVRMLWWLSISVVALSHVLLAAGLSQASFSTAPAQVERFDYVEIIASVRWPRPPIHSRMLRSPEHSKPPMAAVIGASKDLPTAMTAACFASASCRVGGRLHVLGHVPAGRFPRRRQPARFRAVEATGADPLRVDPEYPWHFIWEGTGEHYFFNGTTAFWLMGWREDRVIDIQHRTPAGLKINRMRVLAGREATFFGEPVMNGRELPCSCAPWVRRSPRLNHPGIDYTRFNVPYWQKWERMLRSRASAT